jgi:hypothetical protein
MKNEGRKTAGRVVAPGKRGSGPHHAFRFPTYDGQPPLIVGRLVGCMRWNCVYRYNMLTRCGRVADGNSIFATGSV